MTIKPAAQQYSKILYFTKDFKMRNLMNTVAEQQPVKPRKNKTLDKHYPFNCISRHLPLASLLKGTERAELILPCGFSNGVTWGALRKCWKGYKRAKTDGDEFLMREYAGRIQTLEEQLGVPTASFPNLGMLGDIFFLYDKEKEAELRQQYMFDNVQCDRFGIDNKNIQELIEKGDVKAFDTKEDMQKHIDREHYDALLKQWQEWAMNDVTQEAVRLSQKKWARRDKLRHEVKKIKEEIVNMKVKGKGNGFKGFTEEERLYRRNKREFLVQQKILKESELKSVQTTSIVKTDTGFKFAKEIIKDSLRTKIHYDYEPTYYLTDVNGHRLANYKEEQQYRNDPHFYRLYLEDKEWEKMHQQQ